MIVEVQHSRLGAVKTLGHPVKFSETPTSVRRGAPVLGECTREIMLEHGYTTDEIDKLAAEGVILVT
jgi:crotonobetainyl-CoA:carnitine CoA-transferase CaiB-like acyl-CoA transferase